MWLYTSNSFVSIIATREEPGKLVVRARLRDDILELFPWANVVHTTTTDYPYRAYVNRSEVVDAISRYAQDISYTNFKDSVEKQDLRRNRVYHQVWDVSIGLEDSEHGYPEHQYWGSMMAEAQPILDENGELNAEGLSNYPGESIFQEAPELDVINDKETPVQQKSME